MQKAINAGKTTETAVAQAVRRLFRVRIQLGMLDPPDSSPYSKLMFNTAELGHDAAHLAVARKAALEAMTLLKNDKSVLPLQPSKLKGKKVALVGVQANISGYYFGNYGENGASNNWGASVLEAMTARLAPAGVTVTFDQGLQDLGNKTSRDAFKAAKALASEADAVVVVLGLAFNDFCHGGGTSPGR
jgi:beta-glucosidase